MNLLPMHEVVLPIEWIRFRDSWVRWSKWM